MYIHKFNFGALAGVQMNMIFVRFDKNVADGFQRRLLCWNVQSVSINSFNEIMHGLTRHTVPDKLACFTIAC